MILFDDKVLLFFASLALTACSSKYAPLTNSSKHTGGYQEWLLKGESTSEIVDIDSNHAETKTNEQHKSAQLTPVRYWLRYQGTSRDTKARITQYWHQRASELCPNGYRVEEHQQTLIQGFVESPVNGRLEKLVTFQPIDNGIIQCVNKSKQDKG